MRNLFFLISLILLSCGGNGSGSKAVGQDEASAENRAAAQNSPEATADKPFPIQYGAIHQKISMIGVEQTPIIYFDKWGRWQSEEKRYEMKVMDQTIVSHTLKIHKGDDVWDIDLVKKTGAHYKVPALKAMGYDLDAMSEEMKKQFHVKELGDVEYLGYPCKKFSMKMSESSNAMECITYGNLLMRSAGSGTLIEVTSIDPSRPAESVFDVPAGIAITESEY